MLESIKGYKTVAFAFLVAGLGAIQMADVATVVPPQYAGLVMTVIGLIIGWLRLQTTTPVGTK
jgi:hypothetical protein